MIIGKVYCPIHHWKLFIHIESLGKYQGELYMYNVCKLVIILGNIANIFQYAYWLNAESLWKKKRG